LKTINFEQGFFGTIHNHLPFTKEDKERKPVYQQIENIDSDYEVLPSPYDIDHLIKSKNYNKSLGYDAREILTTIVFLNDRTGKLMNVSHLDLIALSRNKERFKAVEDAAVMAMHAGNFENLKRHFSVMRDATTSKLPDYVSDDAM
jgi:hypothetical protein